MNNNILTATEIAENIRSGKTTPSAVMESCLARIKLREERIGAFSYIDYDKAMALAHRAEKNPTDGPLFGVPFAVKDIIDVAGCPITQGSPIYNSRTPKKDADCIVKLTSAGAIPIGITVSTEFACFTPGKTVNPHNVSHTPGGSSSGSAAAVADNMVPFGLGSQTAASLIRPGSYCGVFAYKSTNGYFNLDGILPLSASLDSLGVLARSLPDLQLVRSVLKGDQHNKINRDVNPRIAFMKGPHWDEMTEVGKENFYQAHARLFAHSQLHDCKRRVQWIDYPEEFDLLTDAHKIVMTKEISQTRRYEYENHRDQLSLKFVELYEEGLARTDEEYKNALKIRDRVWRMLSVMFKTFDIIATPATSGVAPKGLTTTGDPLFSRDWTLLQLPAVTIPFGLGPNNLPLSVQIIGWRDKDSALIDIASRFNYILTKYN